MGSVSQLRTDYRQTAESVPRSDLICLSRVLFALLANFLILNVHADDDLPQHNSSSQFRISEDGTYFAVSRGDPTLWLADTWWFCPSALCPIDSSSQPNIPSMFKALVDLRAKQGFNVVQMAFLGAGQPRGRSLLDLYAKSSSERERTAYWSNAKRYIGYANERGLTVAVGVGFHRDLDTISSDQLQLLWKDVIDELGQFHVIWFIVGEYNLFADRARIEKIESLISFIRTNDPWKRLVTLHPADWRRPVLSISSQTILDFQMVQSGHQRGKSAALQIYSPIRRPQAPIVPIVEAECLYEGIHGNTTEHDVRTCMTRAVMAGAAGFSYGAHGLWYPAQSVDDKRFIEYGPSPPWWVAMNYPGAASVGRLRKFFEQVEWWKMKPASSSLLVPEVRDDLSMPLARKDGDSRILIWFPSALFSSIPVALNGLRPRASYCYQWISGNSLDARIQGGDALIAENRFTSLPSRPGTGDWFLLMTVTDSGSCTTFQSGPVNFEPPATE